MHERNRNIENQYKLQGLYEEIVKRLKEQNVDFNTISRSAIAGVDEFHVRGAQVSEELVSSVNLTNLKVLDVGCGLGGPSRMLADKFNCSVSGIDMSPEYINTAQKLSALVGLSEKTEFIKGDALDLPFEDKSFDVVWTQHVQMNIENKNRFYSEIRRVLKKGGMFIYYDIFKKNDRDVNYPVPWANDASISFLGSIENMESILKDLDFGKLETKDQSEKAMEFLFAMFDKIKTHGPPKLGLNVLMGNSTKDKLSNVLLALEDNIIELQSGIYKV